MLVGMLNNLDYRVQYIQKCMFSKSNIRIAVYYINIFKIFVMLRRCLYKTLNYVTQFQVNMHNMLFSLQNGLR